MIPPGKVATYGKVASCLPLVMGLTLRDLDVFGPRWVGAAMAACPVDVPWQRVINAQGKISVRGEEAQRRQRILLEAEGVQFDAKGRIDLDKYGWDGPELVQE